MGQLLWLNEEPVREMTISHSPQREEKALGTPHLPKEPKPSVLILQGSSLHISSPFYF